MGNTVVTNMGRKLKEERVYVYVWLIYFAVQQKTTRHCKATKFQQRKKKKGKISPSGSKWFQCIAQAGNYWMIKTISMLSSKNQVFQKPNLMGHFSLSLSFQKENPE